MAPRNHTPHAPPRLAMWLIQRRLPDHEREFFVGDMLERFHSAGDDPHSRREARTRIWREALSITFRKDTDPLAAPATRGVLTDTWFDCVVAVRRLRQTPGFTLAVSVTLALGVSAACAIFAVARPVLWGPLPFREADRIAVIGTTSGRSAVGRVGYTTISDLRARTKSFDALATISMWGPTLTDAGNAERLAGVSVSADFFTVMGVRPAFGRSFLPEEDRPGAPSVAILSHGLWTRRFGGDSSVLFRTVQLNELPYTVVGVMPPSYESVLAPAAEIMRPLRYSDTLSGGCRACRHLQAVGRLRNDVSTSEAAVEVEQAFSEMRSLYPVDYFGDERLAVVGLRELLVTPVKRPLYVLLGASGLLLLIALANATNLFVARAARRHAEISVRAALGAGRWRLTRTLLIEALLTATLGGFFGAALTQGALGTLLSIAPSTLPRLDQVQMNGGVALFAGTLALVLGVISGLVPNGVMLRRLSDSQLYTTTRTIARGGFDALRRGLVVTEMCLAVLLLFGAGLLIRSVDRLLSVDAGFATEQRLTVALSVLGPRFNDDASVFATWEALHGRVRTVPGVISASLTSQLPMSSDFDGWGIHLEQVPGRPNAQGGDAFRFAVTPDYAETMGLRLISGRFLKDSDGIGSTPVVVINETFADRLFPGRSPLGERVVIGAPDGTKRTIVGVVNDIKHRGLDSGRGFQIYLPMVQNQFADAYVRLIVHTRGEPGSMVSSLRQAIADVDRSIPMSEVMTFDAMIEQSTGDRRFAKQLFVLFAGTALVLAAIGVFGVLSGMVEERTREIGVRSALGATRSEIVVHFMRQGLTLAVAGIGAGAVIGTLLAPSLSSLVYEVSPRDPATLAVVALLLAAIAAVATALPALRASRVDALEALRAE